jgi:trigger factor
MSLKITTEPMENRQLAVSIEVDQARVDQQLRKAAKKLAKQYRIPGFRKGKVPYEILVRYIGPKALYDEFIDDLGQEVYAEALKEGDFKPYAMASLVDVSLEPLTYKLVTPLEPTVDLGDYRSLRVEAKPVEIKEEELTERLEAYREQYAGWNEADRPSKYGDEMNIDVVAVIPAEGEDGEETVVLDEADWEVIPDEENPMEPPGFDEALLDLSPGEEKEFDLSWPEDSKSIYAGKTAHFAVKVNSIQAYVKPELNDEFAQLIGPDYETLDDLMADLRETLKKEAEQEADNAYLEEAMNALLEQAELDYPPVVVEDQLDAMLQDYEQRLRQYGIEDLAAYFEQTGQSLEDYRESLRPNAIQLAERNLILSELISAEQLVAADEDVEEKITEFIGDVGDDEEALESAAGLAEILRGEAARGMFVSQILQEKAIDRLRAIALGEEIPEPVVETETEEVEEEETDAGVEDEAEADDASEGETESGEPADDESDASEDDDDKADDEE